MIKRITLAAAIAAFIVPAAAGLTVAEASSKNPQAVNMRINSVCNAAAQITRFATPNAAFEMCWEGARTAYNGGDAKCKINIGKFNTEAQRLTKQARAEYVEIGNAYRQGCNIGKSSREAGL